jgi:RNA polymerase sigma-70 factor (ECF subfamily)
MEHTDKDLIARYRDGDTDALGELVERYRRQLFGYILNMTGGSTDADEVFQEVWFRAIRRLPRYRHGNFPGWLMRIARNFVIDRARQRKPVRSLDETRADGDAWVDRVADPAPGPGHAAEDRELGAQIRSAVAQLPAEQREVFVLRVQSGLPFKEIAALQGVSINTALARMQYALSKLRKELREEYEDLAKRGDGP